MSRVSNLFRLQEIDLELLDSQARIDEIDLILGQDEDLRKAKSLLEDQEGIMSEARSANSSAEHAVGSQRDKIAQTDKALYSGSVTNPKELQDLQMTLEDRYLEAMVVLEQAENAHLEATEALDVLQQRKARQHSQLTAEKEELIGNIARLDEERQAATVDVNDEDYALYDELQVRLSGKVLALLSDGVCSACGVELARSRQQEVASGSDLVRCSQCSRILYAG
jgi:predicted  nucleic acid-binding Zn-ribbon protein